MCQDIIQRDIFFIYGIVIYWYSYIELSKAFWLFGLLIFDYAVIEVLRYKNI